MRAINNTKLENIVLEPQDYLTTFNQWKGLFGWGKRGLHSDFLKTGANLWVNKKLMPSKFQTSSFSLVASRPKTVLWTLEFSLKLPNEINWSGFGVK